MTLYCNGQPYAQLTTSGWVYQGRVLQLDLLVRYGGGV